MSDLQIRQDILDELDFEPSIDSSNIGVAVENGIASLTGHVATYREKLEAEAAARRVRGVRAIAEHIEVRHADRKKHADDEIASRALAIIAWDTALPEGAISVKVENGLVTLAGEVRWHFQREAAVDAVKKLGGVKSVLNMLTIRPIAQVPDVKDKIERALARSAEVSAEGIRIDVSGQVVTLKGTVHDARERMLAEQAAWSAPSVIMVENHLTVAAG